MSNNQASTTNPTANLGFSEIRANKLTPEQRTACRRHLREISFHAAKALGYVCLRVEQASPIDPDTLVRLGPSYLSTGDKASAILRLCFQNADGGFEVEWDGLRLYLHGAVPPAYFNYMQNMIELVAGHYEAKPRNSGPERDPGCE